MADTDQPHADGSPSADPARYYLLDGKEHGPVSEMALRALLTTGKLATALVRVGKQGTWESAQEYAARTGMVAGNPKPTAPVNAGSWESAWDQSKRGRAASDNPAQASSSGTARNPPPQSKSWKTEIVTVAVLAAIGVAGWWFVQAHPELVTSSAAPAATDQTQPAAAEPFSLQGMLTGSGEAQFCMSDGRCDESFKWGNGYGEADSLGTPIRSGPLEEIGDVASKCVGITASFGKYGGGHYAICIATQSATVFGFVEGGMGGVRVAAGQIYAISSTDTGAGRADMFRKVKITQH